jgi:hypothetical protein
MSERACFDGPSAFRDESCLRCEPRAGEITEAF